MPWDLVGNKGIKPTSNFLGTTDNQPLIVKTNGAERMRIGPDGSINWSKSQLSSDQGGSLELGGNNSTPGTGTPYIDFHFQGKTQDFNARIINRADGVLSLEAPAKVSVSSNFFEWGNSALGADQGGCIELGANNNTPGAGTPYIDFHFRGLTQDFNTRIINDANGKLSVVANTLGVSGNIETTGDLLFKATTASAEDPGDVIFQSAGGSQKGRIWSNPGPGAGLHLSSAGITPHISITGDGNVEVRNDIRLLGADCAEDFDVASAGGEVEPGTVMVIDEEGALKPSEQPYDKRVAGVISGGGDYRAGLLLDRQEESEANRMPVALMGKVACKVEARDSPIEVGDLLTTAATPGYAMKAADPGKAPGAVIGKALQRLTRGQGLVPILVSLQ